jgi:ribosomal protein S21
MAYDREDRRPQTQQVSPKVGSEAVVSQALEVDVTAFYSPERAYKLFKQMVQKERIVSEYKEHCAYEKPSDKKRRLRKEAARKRFELERKESRDQEYRKKAKKRKPSKEETTQE